MGTKKSRGANSGGKRFEKEIGERGPEARGENRGDEEERPIELQRSGEGGTSAREGPERKRKKREGPGGERAQELRKKTEGGEREGKGEKQSRDLPTS